MQVHAEWNLRDITAAGSDFLLQMLEYRATHSLEEQYISGFDNHPGDYELIIDIMRTWNLQHVNSFKDYYKLNPLILQNKEILVGFKPAIDAGLCVPSRRAGELVLLRQNYLLRALNIIIEDIMEEGSTTRSQRKQPKKSSDAAATALSQLSIKDSTPKLDLPSLLDSALDQKASLDNNLALLCTKPVVLSHTLNIWFFSRFELVANEKGRTFPVHTDRCISGAFLDTIHSAVKGAAIWDYMCRLLELLKGSTDNSHRAVLLQEISNVCHLEYSRAQALLKRHMSIGSGSKWLKRVSNAYNNSNARITLKGNPESLMQNNPQLHHLLRLCQPEVTAPKDNPAARDSLHEGEVDNLSDLAVIVAFIQSLSSTISMPAFNRKNGQLFVVSAAELEAEVDQVEPELNLSDFAIPIDNLLEPGMAEAALKAFDTFIIEKTGTKLGFLYLDLIDDCMTKLQEQLKAQDQLKAQAEKETKSEYIPFPTEPPKAPEARAVAATQPPPPPPEPFKVKSATAEVFSTLFGRSESRGSVPWVSLEAALAELGFTVMPKFGSVFTFFPPQGLAIQKPLTLHRPHQSRIEGYLLLVYARRLNRLYGWGEGTSRPHKWY
ncbi:hypothetical protein HD806DRAFT_524545 [Xylariaceae sp. AK1471]|nr:hypothetical protein HD806DRAFT_524545 [Xylariaceae sp. AK1471]